MEDPKTKNARVDLDETVANIELTLISIIQAIPLGILAERIVDPMLHREWALLLYGSIGLLSIFVFWSRALIHTLSFIGWPLDFTHNFLYILTTLIQSAVIAQIANPSGWYSLGAVYSVGVWVMYVVDLRMIRMQLSSVTDANAHALLLDVLDDQIRNIRVYFPIGTVFNAVAWVCVVFFPATFVEGGWHIALAALQLIAGCLYLWEGYGILRRRNDRILRRNIDAID